MARSRNIKPGFFSNDVLGELPPLARLLFAGLWTICDREGRCEDRPKRIKAELLPYDQCDVDELLNQLAGGGFIDRYVAAGVAVIQVVAWHKHQNPHVKEGASTLPARDKEGPGKGPDPDQSGDKPDPAPDKPGASTRQEQCKSGASTKQAPDKEQPKPARAGLIPDSGFLIPDSGFLIPDSLEISPQQAPPVDSPQARALSPEVEVCIALRKAGLATANAHHPMLAALCAAGATVEEFTAAAPRALRTGDPFAYVLAVVQGRRQEAAKAAATMHHGALPEKPLTPGEQRMLEAVPNLVSESVKRRAAAQNVPKEIIDASPARSLG